MLQVKLLMMSLYLKGQQDFAREVTTSLRKLVYQIALMLYCCPTALTTATWSKMDMCH